MNNYKIYILPLSPKHLAEYSNILHSYCMNYMFAGLVSCELTCRNNCVFLVTNEKIPFFVNCSGILLKPATITSRGGNPYVAVIISWFLVQVGFCVNIYFYPLDRSSFC